MNLFQTVTSESLLKPILSADEVQGKIVDHSLGFLFFSFCGANFCVYQFVCMERTREIWSRSCNLD